MPTEQIIAPVVCACSGTQEHTKEHEECRCNGRYRRNSGLSAPYIEEHIFPKNLYDDKGFWHCQWCGKAALKTQLVQCPECHKWFKGPKPYFKVDFECEDCG